MIITYLFGFGKGSESVAEMLERGFGRFEEGIEGGVGGLGEGGVFDDDEIADLIVELVGKGAVENAVQPGLF